MALTHLALATVVDGCRQLQVNSKGCQDKQGKERKTRKAPDFPWKVWALERQTPISLCVAPACLLVVGSEEYFRVPAPVVF